jgi:single-strand DNA-binding protein
MKGMMKMNKTILMGRLTKEPELRYTATSNIPYSNFTLAVNRRVKSAEQDVDFINCVAWNKTAEFVQKYFSKGQQIALDGRIQTRSYDDNEGKKRYVTEVVAENVYFADSKREKSNDTAPVDDGFSIVDDDELPF